MERWKSISAAKKVGDFLNKIKKEFGKLPTDLHITRKACAFVAISNGKIIKVEKPLVHYCPLFKSLFSYKSINKKSIIDKFEKQKDERGMFTCHRKISDEKIIVPFGASEMMMYALKRGNIEAAVIVCEGVGTVITSEPGVVQGIGAYMNGIFYTSPIREVISKIEENNSYVLSSIDAEIDQLKGVGKALNYGYRNIAVTVRGDEDDIIFKIMNLEQEYNANIVILVVCNTGIDEEQAMNIKIGGDLIWACASKHVRDIIGPESILQVGMKIPVFVVTKKGVNFITSYSKDSNLGKFLSGLENKHYITSNRYEDGGIKVNMGKFSVYLYETDILPIKAIDQPEPLI
ncbi:MAG: DUF2099 family protein [Actinobacteria bacterium]|nr:DUF2099 family protein [Actinomycetota bacterium]